MHRHGIGKLLAPIRQFQSRTADGKERLWKVWWLAGIPVGWLTSALVLFSEGARSAGHGGWGDALDVARFLTYLAWFRLAWRCSRNVGHPAWTSMARGALVLGLVLSGMV